MLPKIKSLNKILKNALFLLVSLCAGGARKMEASSIEPMRKHANYAVTGGICFKKLFSFLRRKAAGAPKFLIFRSFEGDLEASFLS